MFTIDPWAVTTRLPHYVAKKRDTGEALQLTRPPNVPSEEGQPRQWWKDSNPDKPTNWLNVNKVEKLCHRLIYLLSANTYGCAEPLCGLWIVQEVNDRPNEVSSDGMSWAYGKLTWLTARGHEEWSGISANLQGEKTLEEFLLRLALPTQLRRTQKLDINPHITWLTKPYKYSFNLSAHMSMGLTIQRQKRWVTWHPLKTNYSIISTSGHQK